MRACWLKWVGRDWSISADYIWLNYSGANNVNSEPRGALGFATPACAFKAMPGEDAAALLDAYGVGDVPLGDLDLTPGLIERARAERGDALLA